MAPPGDGLRLPQAKQQPELLVEEVVVVDEVVAEKRERLDERAAAGHHLDAPSREQVQRRELLEHAHRVVGAQHRHRAGQPDPLGPRRRSGEHHRGRGHHEVGAVVLPDGEDVQADALRELDLLDKVLQALRRRRLHAAPRVGLQLAEAVDAELHGQRPCDLLGRPAGPRRWRSARRRITPATVLRASRIAPGVGRGPARSTARRGLTSRSVRHASHRP